MSGETWFVIVCCTFNVVLGVAFITYAFTQLGNETKR